MQEVIAHGGATTDPEKVSFQGCYIHMLTVSAPYAPAPLPQSNSVPFDLVLNLGPGLDEFAPVKYQVRASWPEEYILNNIQCALWHSTPTI
jgi:hypothetical protein